LKNADPIMTQQYIEKADQFLQSMQLLADDIANYRSGIGLMAIHSAISLTDAITVGLTGTRGKYDDHAESARELERLCASNRISNRQGVKHFRWLLQKKNTVAYEHARFDDDSVRLAVDKADRFSAWAYNQFKEILRGAQAGP
jgi:hypothetical protein